MKVDAFIFLMLAIVAAGLTSAVIIILRGCGT